LLSIAGWWLGDLAGAANPLFQFHSLASNPLHMSDGWALALAARNYWAPRLAWARTACIRCVF
jgi:hypothetical protein